MLLELCSLTKERRHQKDGKGRGSILCCHGSHLEDKLLPSPCFLSFKCLRDNHHFHAFTIRRWLTVGSVHSSCKRSKWLRGIGMCCILYT